MTAGGAVPTILSMAVSGFCSATVGLFYGKLPFLVIAICVLWGISVVADSAQFSASVTELSDPSLTGTMLTIQTSLGFLITLITTHLIPALVGTFGWRYAFVPLALGPLVGISAMAKLRQLPESRNLAGGRR